MCARLDPPPCVGSGADARLPPFYGSAVESLVSEVAFDYNPDSGDEVDSTISVPAPNVHRGPVQIYSRYAGEDRIGYAISKAVQVTSPALRSALDQPLDQPLGQPRSAGSAPPLLGPTAGSAPPLLGPTAGSARGCCESSHAAASAAATTAATLLQISVLMPPHPLLRTARGRRPHDAALVK